MALSLEIEGLALTFSCLKRDKSALIQALGAAAGHDEECHRRYHARPFRSAAFTRPRRLPRRHETRFPAR